MIQHFIDSPTKTIFFYDAEDPVEGFPDTDGILFSLADDTAEFYDTDANSLFPVTPVGEMDLEIKFIVATYNAYQNWDSCDWPIVDPYEDYGLRRSDFY